MSFKGVIFDLDGTLLDTMEDLTDSVNAAMEALGAKKLSLDEVMARVGNGFKVLLERSMPEYMRTEENIDLAYNVFVKKYEQCYTNHTKPYEGIVELVEKLSNMHIPMTVNTNKRGDYAKRLIDLHFGEDTFMKVLGDRMGYSRKPDPNGALSLAELMNCSVDEIVYVGDSQVDMATGKNAGIKTIGVSWGFRGRQILEACGADYIVDTPQEIYDIIVG